MPLGDKKPNSESHSQTIPFSRRLPVGSNAKSGARQSSCWQSGSFLYGLFPAIVTFLMVFMIQNTQSRDTQAMQLKLDELIRVNEIARNSLINLEEMSEIDVERMKTAFATLAAIETAPIRSMSWSELQRVCALALVRDRQSDSRNQHAHGHDCHEAQPRLFPPRSACILSAVCQR
jgi:hypothetical protein